MDPPKRSQAAPMDWQLTQPLGGAEEQGANADFATPAAGTLFHDPVVRFVSLALVIAAVPLLLPIAGEQWRATYGREVHRVALDAGSTCPNRDGTKGLGGCTYCDVEGSGTGALKTGQDLDEQLETGLRARSDNRSLM